MSYNHYITSPLLEKNYYSDMGRQFSSPLKELNEQTIFTENEEVNGNDSYRSQTKYDDKVDRYYSSYGVDSLIQNKESYLEGKISSQEDVDYYSFSYRQKAFYDRMGVSASVTISIENVSENNDLELSVYDTNGNYIGTAKKGENGCHELTLPQYVNSPNDYIIRVSGKDGENIGEGSYRIRIREDKEKDSQTEKPSHNQSAEEIAKKEYDALPEQEKYQGKESVEELLQRLAAGDTLTTEEKQYIKIFSNLSNYERAEAENYLKNVLYPAIGKELKKAGIDTEGKSLSIEIGIDGNVLIMGELEEAEKETVKEIITEKFADKLWDKYMQASDLSRSEYRQIEAYKELNDFIAKSTNGKYSFTDITVDNNGKISGLPEDMCKLLNSQESNGRYEELRDHIFLLAVDGKQNLQRLQQIVEKKVQFRF